MNDVNFIGNVEMKVDKWYKSKPYKISFFINKRLAFVLTNDEAKKMASTILNLQQSRNRV